MRILGNWRFIFPLMRVVLDWGCWFLVRPGEGEGLRVGCVAQTGAGQECESDSLAAFLNDRTIYPIKP